MKTNYWHKFEPNNWYHIYNRGIDRKPIFRSDDNYRFFLRRCEEKLSPYLQVGAYCLLPNHFHLLVKVSPISDKILQSIENEGTRKAAAFLTGEISYNTFLEDQHKRLFSSYSLAFNKQHHRTGSLLQKRFKRILLRSRDRLMYQLAYIHHNPIHHGYRPWYSQWKYSSYNAYLKRMNTFGTNPDIWDLFHPYDPEKAYTRLHQHHDQFVL